MQQERFLHSDVASGVSKPQASGPTCTPAWRRFGHFDPAFHFAMLLVNCHCSVDARCFLSSLQCWCLMIRPHEGHVNFF